MKQISGSTFLFKKFLPTAVFLFLVVGLIAPLLPGAEKVPSRLLVAPIILACAAFLFFKKTIWGLADVVYDNGDELIFRKGKKEQRVKLCDIINISYSSFNSPQRIEIHVKSKGAIGNILVFRPPMRLIPLGRNPLVLELVERIDRARVS